MTAMISYRGSDGCELFAWRLRRDVPRDGRRPTMILMHGGGPDHGSLLPLARRLRESCDVVLPDVRGYGRSICTCADRHTWSQYARDVVSLMDRLAQERAMVGGAGLGGTVALRTALEHPDRISALVVMSAEDIEDDVAKRAETAFMDAFAARVRSEGIERAWAPILPDLPPVIGAMVRDAIPRSSPDSIAAAAAIGHDRAFRAVEDLAPITAPALIFPGMDWRHPAALASRMAGILPQGRLAASGMSGDMADADDFADAFAPAIRAFVADVHDGR
jgi:pimeloyl-ACP methyl ester carboxylesterase